MVSTGINFGKFTWDKGGYIALMNSSKVQSILEKKANAIENSANSALSKPDGHTQPGYKAKKWQGRMANGYVVHSNTRHGTNSQAKNKTLTKAFKSNV